MTRPGPTRVMISALAALALLAGSLVLCPCSTPSESAHACCETPVWRAAGVGCCGAAGETPEAVAAPTPDGGFMVATAATHEPGPARLRPAVRSVPTASVISPPRTVLRI